jgi:hypothetical protein
MPPSSPEEIARQHQEAMMLVYGGGGGGGSDNNCSPVLKCSPHKELGEVSLEDKVQPTWIVPTPPTSPLEPTTTTTSSDQGEEKKETTDEDDDDKKQQEVTKEELERRQKEDEERLAKVLSSLHNPDCWSTRGQVDVTKLQRMVQEGFNLKYNDKETLPPLSPTNYWDPRNADKHNVSLTRPSHDGWGIGKIVLMFSDDFLTKVYQLPWWEQFEEALQPILDALKNDRRPSNSDERIVVVRALLASLPPGVTIPVHNDSGEWVKTTHRVHVPVLVKDPHKILFRVGPAPHCMHRIDCSPGHVFEINNQAKHAVSNCELDEQNSRVHLILDYVTTAEKPGTSRFDPIVLEPGEKLVQTRRSIDRLKDMSERPTPTYIILGAQKAGTTSLYGK